MSILNRAAKLAIDRAGGPIVVARHFVVSRQAVHQWLATCIPPARVIELERLSGVSRHLIRPDIFGTRTADKSKIVA